jgi:hypothetical protein
MTDPVAFFASLGMDAALGGILAWIAFAVAAAMGLVFVLLGIRKGLSWFMAVVEERRSLGDSPLMSSGTMSELDRAAAIYDRNFSSHGDLYSVRVGDDDEVARFHAFLQEYSRYGDDGDNFHGSSITADDLEHWRE